MHELIEKARQEGRRVLNAWESQKVFEHYGIKFAKSALVRSEKELKGLDIAFPWAMKIVSSEILHKSDVGCVKLNIRSVREAKEAFREIMERARKITGNIEGVEVQEMVRGTELIFGIKRDKQFGPVVLFGLGGIFVEIIRDFSLRIAPITRRDAEEMVRELKGYAVLTGARGVEPVNLEAVYTTLLSLSNLAMKEPLIEEADLNPVFGNRKGVFAVDARIIISS